MKMASQLEWLAAVIGLIGLWLVVGPPFLFEAPFADFWSDLLVGVALVALAAYTYARRGSASSRWSAAAAAVLGGWLIVAAVLWETSATLHWNDVAAGVVVAIAGGYGGYGAHEAYGESGTGDKSADAANGDLEGDSEDESGDGGDGDDGSGTG